MSSSDTQISPIKRALHAVKDMQAKLNQLEYAQNEPIAVVGMSCRFPGDSNSPEAFWDLLQQGKDAVVKVPSERWDADAYYDADPYAPGKTYTREAGFLKNIDLFDASFFDISAREAASLDPQQRLLLEVCWEALEQGNQASESLFTSKTGVFIGICNNDYHKMIWELGGAEGFDAFCATGNALSVAAGRVSHALGLKGPSLAIDTACSSALVSVHLACQSLRNQECKLALAGGVHLLLSPDSTVAFSRTQMLDPSGKCRTFDAQASGYARGEGCGVVVLKRLSDAKQDHDNILAVIKGSAVNHNGRSSSLIAPNGTAQQTVIRQALEMSKVDSSKVGYVEVQGTGSATGQSIEVGAIAAVFCQGRIQEEPLNVGSVKTNIGHLEGASGIASFIKVILSLKHQEIPANLNFEQPNPYIDWKNLPIQVPTKSIPWPLGDHPRSAGINCFGFSGTNAHVVLEEAPNIDEPSPNSEDRSSHILSLSAKTSKALQELVVLYQAALSDDSNHTADICFSANTGRSHFPYRLSVAGSSNQDLIKALSYAEVPTEGITSPPKVAFLLTGNINRYEREQIQELYETQPFFQKAIDQCDNLADDYISKKLLSVDWSIETVASNIMSFAVEYSLCQLWKSWGVKPVCLIASGIGEVVAACVSGIYDLTTAIKLLDKSEAVEVLNQSNLPILNTTGQNLEHSMLNADYWHSRFTNSSIESSKTINSQNFRGSKIDSLLLINQGILLKLDYIHTSYPIVKLTSHNKTEKSIWQSLLTSLSELYDQGVPINWLSFDQGYYRKNVTLPTYPWQHQSYWIDSVDRTTGEFQPFSVFSQEQVLSQIELSDRFSEMELEVIPKLLEWLSQLPIQTQKPLKKETSSQLLNQPDENRLSVNLVEQQLKRKTISQADIQKWLTEQIAKELGIAPSSLSLHEPFEVFGLDSVLAINIASAGRQAFGVEVTPLMLVHYPTIASLSAHIETSYKYSATEIFEI